METSAPLSPASHTSAEESPMLLGSEAGEDPLANFNSDESDDANPP